jgi:16S rRNA (guanine527-N7)-methyltransferase
MTILAQRLEAGLQAQGLALGPEVQARLLEFIALLARWNRAYNLTAVREPAQMLTKHLLDSLSLLPYLEGERVLDVGSGGGLPGIPLALAAPGRQFVLLDSNSKKTRFLTQAKAELGLDNVTVVHSRLERYQTGQLFDTVTSRAFSTLETLCRDARHLLAPHGVILAMKGEYPLAELEALPPGFALRDVLPLTVAGLKAQRHVVRIEQQGNE